MRQYQASHTPEVLPQIYCERIASVCPTAGGSVCFDPEPLHFFKHGYCRDDTPERLVSAARADEEQNSS